MEEGRKFNPNSRDKCRYLSLDFITYCISNIVIIPISRRRAFEYTNFEPVRVILSNCFFYTTNIRIVYAIIIDERRKLFCIRIPREYVRQWRYKIEVYNIYIFGQVRGLLLCKSRLFHIYIYIYTWHVTSKVLDLVFYRNHFVEFRTSSKKCIIII